jgi:hypothetical protein
MVIAGVLFLIDAFRPRPTPPGPPRLFLSLGLAFLTAGFIFEFVIHTTSGLVIIH